MELLIDKHHLQDATIPVRWCLTKNEIERLEKHYGTKNSQLLIVVSQKSNRQYMYDVYVELQRILVPLDQMMHYVSFTKPGENIIQVAVIPNEANSTKKLRNYLFLKRTDGSYQHSICDELSGETRQLGGIYNLGITAKITVDVDKRFFANEPAKWEKWWVNLWYETPAIDQCHFRKRRMLAYSIQPLIVGIWAIFIIFIRLILTVLITLTGSRCARWKAIFRPFVYRTADVLDEDKMSFIFLTDKNGNKRPRWIRLFNYPVIFLLFSILLVIDPLGLESALYYLLLTPFILALIYGFTFGCLLITVYTLSHFSSEKYIEEKKSKKKVDELLKQARRDEKNRIKKEQRRKRINEQYSPLVCNFIKEDKQEISVSSLPKDHRTIRLRFLDLKSKVCRPYAN